MSKKNENTVQVSSWEEMIKYVHEMNPNKHTILLSGYINELIEDRYFIRTLVFSKRPVTLLKSCFLNPSDMVSLEKIKKILEKERKSTDIKEIILQIKKEIGIEITTKKDTYI